MDFNSFLEQFSGNLANTSSWEIIAVAFGIASVWFARQANILVFPTGIVSTVIYIFICFFARFYADMGINAFYTAMSFYGWYMWTRKDANQKVIPIKWNSPKQQITGIALIPILYLIILGLIWLFNKDDVEYMRSYVPYVDSFTTSIFLVGMWFMARKRVENWVYWIAGNIISIPMYFAKGLVFTSFQFSVFLVLAIMGFMEWRKKAAKCE